MRPFFILRREMDYKDRMFNHHPPGPDAIKSHEAVRAAFKKLVEEIEPHATLPYEWHITLERLQEAMFWANASVARFHAGGWNKGKENG
jgi:hypothetical protein